MKKRFAAVGAALALTALAGCTTSTPPTYMEAFYPPIHGVTEVIERSDLAAAVEVLGSREDIVHPEVSFEGDPSTNPQAGLTEDDIDQQGVPVTITDVRVIECLMGDCEAGETLSVQQMGGRMDGIEYIEVNSLLLEDATSDQLVLFLSDSAGVYSLVHPTAGLQALDGDMLVAAESEDGEMVTDGLNISMTELRDKISLAGK